VLAAAVGEAVPVGVAVAVSEAVGLGDAVGLGEAVAVGEAVGLGVTLTAPALADPMLTLMASASRVDEASILVVRIVIAPTFLVDYA
jgi:hypothetical protein